MVDALAPVWPDIGHEPPSFCQFGAHLVDQSEQGSQELSMFGTELSSRRDMAAWDHQKMGRGLGIQVLEHQTMVVFGNYCGGDIAGNY